MRVVDPYREENERALEYLARLSHDEKVKLLESAGIIDKRGNLAAKYRTPKASRSAKPRSTKGVGRKRVAS